MTMRGVVEEIPIPTGTGLGDPRKVLHLSDLVVGLDVDTLIPVGGSYQLEGSICGTTYFSIGSAMTAKGDLVDITAPKKLQFLRVNVTSHPTGGTYKLQVIGNDVERGS